MKVSNLKLLVALRLQFSFLGLSIDGNGDGFGKKITVITYLFQCKYIVDYCFVHLFSGSLMREGMLKLFAEHKRS